MKEVAVCIGAGLSPAGHLSEVSKKIVERVVFFENFCSEGLRTIVFAGGYSVSNVSEGEKMKKYAKDLGIKCQNLLISDGELLFRKAISALGVLRNVEELKGHSFSCWVVDQEVRLERSYKLFKSLGRRHLGDDRSAEFFPCPAEEVYDDLTNKSYWSSQSIFMKREKVLRVLYGIPFPFFLKVRS